MKESTPDWLRMLTKIRKSQCLDKMGLVEEAREQRRNFIEEYRDSYEAKQLKGTSEKLFLDTLLLVTRENKSHEKTNQQSPHPEKR